MIVILLAGGYAILRVEGVHLNQTLEYLLLATIIVMSFLTAIGLFRDSGGTARSHIIDGWNESLIAKLEWQQFERLCLRIWEEKGYTVRKAEPKAHGGVDFYLHAKTSNRKVGAVKCKSLRSHPVSSRAVISLNHVITSERLKLGLLMFNGKLSRKARSIMRSPKIIVRAQSSSEILREIGKLPLPAQGKLLREMLAGDRRTPSCPRCKIKLVPRKANKTKRLFWGCPNLPACRYMMRMTDD